MVVFFFFFFFFFMSFPKYSNKHVHSRVQFFKRQCTPNTYGSKNNTTYNAPHSNSSLQQVFGSQARAPFMTSTKVIDKTVVRTSKSWYVQSFSSTVMLSLHPRLIFAPFISPWMANSCEIKWVLKFKKN